MSNEVIVIDGVGGDYLIVDSYAGNDTDKSMSIRRLQFTIGREYANLTKEMWEQLKIACDGVFK